MLYCKFAVNTKFSTCIFHTHTHTLTKEYGPEISVWKNMWFFDIYIYIYLYCKYNISMYNIYIYIYIYNNHKTLISNHGCSCYLVIAEKKGANHILHNVSTFASFWCILSKNNLLWICNSTIQLFFHNNYVTVQYKQ